MNKRLGQLEQRGCITLLQIQSLLGIINRLEIDIQTCHLDSLYSQSLFCEKDRTLKQQGLGSTIFPPGSPGLLLLVELRSGSVNHSYRGSRSSLHSQIRRKK